MVGNNNDNTRGSGARSGPGAGSGGGSSSRGALDAQAGHRHEQGKDVLKAVDGQGSVTLTSGATCANCGRQGHTVMRCIKASMETGEVSGCASCNVRDHETDQCASLKQLSVDAGSTSLLNMYVPRRVGLPPLARARGYSWAAHVAFKEAMHGGYPMTAEEGREYMREFPNRWEIWDYSNPRPVLDIGERQLKDKDAVAAYARNNSSSA